MCVTLWKSMYMVHVSLNDKYINKSRFNTEMKQDEHSAARTTLKYLCKLRPLQPVLENQIIAGQYRTQLEL